MAFVEYDQIQDDLVAYMKLATSGFQFITRDAGDVDFNFANFPILDIRMLNIQPEVRAGNQYYVQTVLEFEVAAVDFSSRLEAAKIRNQLMNEVHAAIQQNRRFSSFIDATIIGPVEFEIVEDEKQGAFVASAVGQLWLYSYAQ